MLSTIKSITTVCDADCRIAIGLIVSVASVVLLFLGLLLVMRAVGHFKRIAQVALQNSEQAKADSAAATAWKRAEFVASETKAFFEHPRTRRVLAMCDNTVRAIDTEVSPGLVKPVLFAQERGFLAEAPEPDKHVVLIDALQPHEKKPSFTRLETIARDDFDHFLAGIERFERLIKTGVMNWGDVEPYVDYWVNLLNGGKAHPSRPFLETLRQYMSYYQYSDALAFLNRGVPGATAAAKH